ncbi:MULTISPECIES: stress responsive protein LiaH [Bacillus]|uniref:PspA/IM30 family protein n=1 Tax=Bacillus glycinifermentans TaxID=1664069 RepID=A0AAJ3Z0W6_9BACI|nr:MULTISPECIES: PspA/IM30 family protein [Bacillus]KKB75429.1 protein LiaH [Bacillus sp. TH008]MBU8785508.1 PspA/IM30 family protein [Bacillus glycinifermentans]MDU0070574.1 PspA/IM30 family protein [Bacillus sp. IG6]MED8018438.1 PspA/IM30 family protein [Bacillus glycinifermentans]NUJ15827.1 PspA/IM30 family protein [Bacillus glycinifermentans]
MAFKRIRDMFVASINEGLDKIENPRVMLNQYVRDMENDISKAKHTIVKQQTIAQSFKGKYEEADKLAAKRKNQAQLAFDAGEEELSKKALSEMKYFEQKAKEYKEAYEHAHKQLAELKEQLQTLEVKLRDVKDRKHALIARANAVKAKEHMNASFNKIDSESAYREFMRMENRIEEMEARVNSYAELSASSGSPYSRVEYAKEVEEEFEKMRAKKAGLEKQPAAGNE